MIEYMMQTLDLYIQQNIYKTLFQLNENIKHA